MNTLRTIRTPALLAALALAASACDSGLTDLNRNPNSPDSATPEYLFANATEAAVSRVFGAGLNMDIAALWVQHFAEHRYALEDTYVISDGSVSGHWSGFYAGPLQDFQETITLAEAAGRPNAAAQGRIMQSWTFSVMTDVWGDIGYTEALQGRVSGTGNTPALDPQSEVYDGLLATLRNAQSSLAPGGREILSTADLIYQGDTDKWRKLANSLRLRLSMRLSAVDAGTGSAEFGDALAAGVIESNDDNAALAYIEGTSNVHPLFAYERDRDDHSVSATIIDTLISFADPRLPVYAKLPLAGGGYVGTENAGSTEPALDEISKFGSYFAEAGASAHLMTYAEVLLLRAEAAERGWTAEDPAALYEAAIRASMEQLGIATAAIDTYLLDARVQYAGGAAGLDQIAFQKWIALFGNGVEAWSEWRRTGVPNLQPGPEALNGGLIPVRLPYPQREISLNGANVQEAIDRQGGASLNDPIWWMP
jgi:hypothetical protein